MKKNENCIYSYGCREEIVYSRKEETSVRKSKSNIEENCSIDDFHGVSTIEDDSKNLANHGDEIYFNRVIPSFENKEE